MIELKKPSIELYPAFQKFLEDMGSQGETLWDPYIPSASENPKEFVERLLRRKTHPEAEMVPETIYWAMKDANVVGRISLRHNLKGNLHLMGGHIGYEVRPTFRNQGIATEMLRQVLLTPEARQIGKLLLTCAPENVASNRTIISNGGHLTQTIFVEFIGENRNHYWIELLTD